jgi:hypothetical protein
MTERRRLLLYSAMFLLCLGALAPPAAAEFSTTINVPPKPAPESIDSDTQLNLFAFGRLGDDFVAGSFSGLSTNVEVNVFGGDIGDNFSANGGTTLNLIGGNVGEFGDAFPGSLVNVMGGELGDFFDANQGSSVRIASGSVGAGFDSLSGSFVRLSGGAVGADFNARAGSSVSILGKSFFLGTDEITGTLEPGVPTLISSRQATLSGNLADDMPFSFDLHDTDEPLQDFFDPLATLTITLLHPADYDRNGVVNQGDYLVWRQQFGSTGSNSADGNSDGVVDAADYAVWRDGLQTTAPFASAAPVPSPGSLSLLFLLTVFQLPRRTIRCIRSSASPSYHCPQESS